MKTITAVSALALMVAASPAYAADLNRGSLKDASPVIVNTAPSWTGFYAYVAGSVDAANHDLAITPGIATLNGLSSFGGGVEGGGGYDFQFNSRFVAGLWGYYGYSNASTTATLGTTSVSYDADGRWGAGGRLGWLPSDNAMLYVSGGYGEESFKGTGILAKYLPSHTSSGFLVGGGAEYLLGNGFSAFVDYKAFLANSVTLASRKQDRDDQ